MTVVEERESSVVWLRRKIERGEAGLDRLDGAVMVVEVRDRDDAWLVERVGHVLETHPHTRPNGSHCIRVRSLIEADVRVELGLDVVGQEPVMDDVALASRDVERQARRERLARRHG